MRGCVDERCSLFYFSIELSGMTGRHRYRAMKNKRHLGDNLQASITVAWHQSQQRDRGSVQPLVSMIVDEGEQGGHLYESNSSDPDSPTTLGSTVPSNGDVNPYGVARVPRTVVSLVEGRFLVSNFNKAANEQ